MDLRELFRGEVEKIGIDPHLSAWGPGGEAVIDRGFGEGGANLTHEDLLRELFAWLWQQRQEELEAIGHRIVHGGATFTEPVCINDDVLDKLSKLEPLAPLHQPHNLSGVRTCAALQPHVPQVACFDTAFHQTMDPLARRLGLPRAYDEEGVRRYGFHGLSYEFIARRLGTIDPDLSRGRVIVAHLGNGASLCAMRNGRSIDTTMGFTALDGLLMGTRPGTLDPGAVTYLMRKHGMSAAEIEDLLYHRSGLVGVSGISSDCAYCSAAAIRTRVRPWTYSYSGPRARSARSRLPWAALMASYSRPASASMRPQYGRTSARAVPGWVSCSTSAPTAPERSGSLQRAAAYVSMSSPRTRSA
jgi:acetate kinase